MKGPIVDFSAVTPMVIRKGRTRRRDGWLPSRIPDLLRGKDPFAEPFTRRTYSRVERYVAMQSLKNLPMGESEVIYRLKDETIGQAVNRVRCLLYQCKPTMYFRWSVRKVAGDVLVKKIGTFDGPLVPKRARL
jgi:hypothetical protein